MLPATWTCCRRLAEVRASVGLVDDAHEMSRSFKTLRDLTRHRKPRVGLVRYLRTVRPEKVVNSRLTRLTTG